MPGALSGAKQAGTVAWKGGPSKRRVQWLWRGACGFAFVLAILGFLFGTKVLEAAGRFMAPQGSYGADVAILEGAEFRGQTADVVTTRGVDLLASGKVERLIVVLHGPSSLDGPASYDNQVAVVRKGLIELGVKEEDFKIVASPVGHPTTLTEARVVLESISKDGVKSAILLSHGFHTRRSYLAYQYIGLPLQIRIFPMACLEPCQPLDHWWGYAQGRRYFAEELAKLALYFVSGHIPPRLSY